jgi:hypothetical protein
MGRQLGVELIRANSRSPKREYVDTLPFVERATGEGDCSRVAVVSQRSLRMVWAFLLSDLSSRNSLVKACQADFIMPSVVAACLAPVSYREHYNRMTKHDYLTEYGMTEDEWKAKYKSAGFLRYEPISIPWVRKGLPTWVIIVNGREKVQTYRTLRHEMQHIIERMLKLKPGELSRSNTDVRHLVG